MHPIIKQMLEPYQCQSPDDYKRALKEISQEIVLLALSRQKFFDFAAFYGGTALRICYGLNRFSEDLDFTLIKANPDFNLRPYLKGIEDEFQSFELNFEANHKIKKTKTSVDSAFLKSNTLKILMKIDSFEGQKIGINKNDLVKIKLEIDTIPPNPSGEIEVLTHSKPINFAFKTLSLPSLFAGKLHAVLCRNYKGRVKGRDYFDFAWYMGKGIDPDLDYLKAKLIESQKWTASKDFSLIDLKQMLIDKIKTIDFKQAKKDVLPFIKDPFELEVWNKDFFLKLVDRL